MQKEDDSDNLDKDSQHVEYLSGVSHVEEDSEDVNRKQGKYDSLYGLDNDFLEVVARIFSSNFVSRCANPSPTVNAMTRAVITLRGSGIATVKKGGNTFGLTDFG